MLPLLGSWLTLLLLLVPRQALSPIGLKIAQHPMELAAGLTGILLLCLKTPAGARLLMGSLLLIGVWIPFSGDNAGGGATFAVCVFSLLLAAGLHRLSLELFRTPVPALALGLLDLGWMLYAQLFAAGLPFGRIPLSGLGLLGMAPPEPGSIGLFLPCLPAIVLMWRRRREVAQLLKRI